MLIRIYFISMCICNLALSLALGDWFARQKTMKAPPSLESSLQSFLSVNCKNVNILRSATHKIQYKGQKALEHCLMEQRLLQSIINDDVLTYTSMVADGQTSEYFLFYTTHPPRLEITPLMAAIVFDSTQVFELILADSGKVSKFSRKKPKYDINRVISHDQISTGIFSLGNKIYDTYGVNAIDLSAMYHRYDMFWALLQKGADYNDPKYPLTNGIITFGDPYILELVLYFDENFLYRFGGGNMLHFAAREGNVELLEYLVTHKKMPINALKNGETPLDAALNANNLQHKPQLQAAQKLIELGAKVSEANANRLNKLTHHRE